MTLPTIQIATPVVTSLRYTDAIVPRLAGGWMWISQWFQYPNTDPTDWIVMHLEDATYNIYNDPPLDPGQMGRFANSNFSIAASNVLRAANGNVFFPATAGYWWDYNPNTEVITRHGREGTLGEFFSAVFNHDGSTLYMGTLGNSFSNKLPTIVKIDPTTLAFTQIATIGSNTHTHNAFAYYIRAENSATARVYALVGEDSWDVVSVNVGTGVQTVIQTNAAPAFASFEKKPEGWTVKHYAHYGQPSQTMEQFWLVDGVKYAYTPGYNPATLPFTPRDVTPYTNDVVNPPSLDYSLGPGRLLWRPFGGAGAYTENIYVVPHAEPVNIESLQTLPDGSVLGSCFDYNGFFRYGNNVLSYYGQFPGVTEGDGRIIARGKSYITGYPNGPFYEYNPDAAWDAAGGTNPKLLGAFSNGVNLSAIKHGTNLAYSPALDKMFACGTLDRSDSGAGIGSYTFSTHTFAGKHTGLDFYINRFGLTVLDSISRVVFGGAIGDNPSFPGQTPSEAQLILYDTALNEIERQTPIAGLQETGILFQTGDGTILTGVCQSGLMYRWDVVTKTLHGAVSLTSYGAMIGKSLVQTSTTNAFVIMGSSLYRLNLATLDVILVGDLGVTPTIAKITLSGDDLYLSLDAGLYVIYSIDLIDGETSPGDDTGDDMSTDVPRSTLTPEELMTLAHYRRELADSLDLALGDMVQDISLLTLEITPADVTVTNTSGPGLPKGTPVYLISGGVVAAAKADSATTSTVLGVVSSTNIATSAAGSARIGEFLEASTAQWDAVCGTTGGLTAGANYYLSDSVAGMLTATPPTTAGHELVPVIQGITPSRGKIIIARPILL